MREGAEQPALQVIVLGSSGGPKEDNTTAFLVRSLATGWSKGSVVAVDAGTHLSSIIRILEPYLPEGSTHDSSSPITITSGPFKGLELPFVTASANAAHITRSLIDTYLITHPHLDHISGFVVNTASLPGIRPKRLAGLPSTIAAFKNHIFNNVIWPNLSDENNGAGLVTYMRLVEGGSAYLGDGDGRGYVEISEGLSVKTWSVSHGTCMESHTHYGSSSGLHSHDIHETSPMNRSLSNPPNSASFVHHHSSPVRFESHNQERVCVYDSSAYFIRDISTGREVLIFGDVEPDSISLSPRNQHVWSEAAPKFASGMLKGILIECSYDDSQSDDTLFGHLAPRFLMEELTVLAGYVQVAKSGVRPGSPTDSKKRKRASRGFEGETEIARSHPNTPFTPNAEGRFANAQYDDGISSHSEPTLHSQIDPSQIDGATRVRLTDRTNIYNRKGPTSAIRSFPSGSSTSSGNHPGSGLNLSTSFTDSDVEIMKPDVKGALVGLQVVIIHMKDKLNDGPSIEENILSQLLQYEEAASLGCEFVISRVGMSLFL